MPKIEVDADEFEQFNADYKALSLKLDAAETCCSEMYQVFGSLTDDFDIFAHPLVQKAMTALAERKAPDDLLPWPSKHPDQWKLEARKDEETQ